MSQRYGGEHRRGLTPRQDRGVGADQAPAPLPSPLGKENKTLCLLLSGAKMLFKNEKILPKNNGEAVKEGVQ